MLHVVDVSVTLPLEVEARNLAAHGHGPETQSWRQPTERPEAIDPKTQPMR